MKFEDCRKEFNMMYKKISNPTKEDTATIIKDITSRVDDLGDNMSTDDKLKAVYHKIKGIDEAPKCVICKTADRLFNPEEVRYTRLCGSSACSDKARAIAKDNHIKTFGVATLLNDANHQVKMLQANGNAKTYKYNDGKEYIVRSSIEIGILTCLDKEGFKSDDVEAPSTVFIKYKLPGEDRERVHLPDTFVKSINCIISGKDGLDNPNGHPNMLKDRLKSLIQYATIVRDTKYNFIQVEGKEDLDNLSKYLEACKSANDGGHRFLLPPRVDFAMYYKESDVGVSAILDDELTYVAYVDLLGKVLLDGLVMANIVDKILIYANGKLVSIDVSIINNLPGIRRLVFKTNVSRMTFFANDASNTISGNSLHNILFHLTGDSTEPENLTIEHAEDLIAYLSPFCKSVQYIMQTMNKSKTTTSDYTDTIEENESVSITYAVVKTDGGDQYLNLYFGDIVVTTNVDTGNTTISQTDNTPKCSTALITTYIEAKRIYLMAKYIMSYTQCINGELIISGVSKCNVAIHIKFIISLLHVTLVAKLFTDNKYELFFDMLKQNCKDTNVDVFTSMTDTKEILKDIPTYAKRNFTDINPYTNINIEDLFKTLHDDVVADIGVLEECGRNRFAENSGEVLERVLKSTIK